jgi:hypothetical protein
MTTLTHTKDPVHMDPDGSFWFYNAERTGRYGPYLDDATARSKLGEYLAWLDAQSQPTAEPTPADKLVAEYLALRDLKAETTQRHKEELKQTEDQLEKLEAALLGTLQEMGVESFKTPAGTVFTTKRLFASIADKELISDYIRQTGQVELLQSRISTEALKAFMDENNGACPPGVKAAFERTLSVRRK